MTGYTDYTMPNLLNIDSAVGDSLGVSLEFSRESQGPSPESREVESRSPSHVTTRKSLQSRRVKQLDTATSSLSLSVAAIFEC